MAVDSKNILVCNCNKTMPLDAKALTRALQLKTPVVIHHELCRHQASLFESGLKQGGDVLVACTQEARLFGELAEQIDPNAEVSFVNIREQAGWSVEADKATPKIAALLAAAALPEPEPVPSVSYKSAGQLLIIGPASAALGWAEQLADKSQGQKSREALPQQQPQTALESKQETTEPNNQSDAKLEQNVAKA